MMFAIRIFGLGSWAWVLGLGSWAIIKDPRPKAQDLLLRVFLSVLPDMVANSAEVEVAEDLFLFVSGAGRWGRRPTRWLPRPPHPGCRRGRDTGRQDGTHAGMAVGQAQTGGRVPRPEQAERLPRGNRGGQLVGRCDHAIRGFRLYVDAFPGEHPHRRGRVVPRAADDQQQAGKFFSHARRRAAANEGDGLVRQHVADRLA